MKSWRCARKIVKWGSAAVAGLLLAMWAASLFWSVARISASGNGVSLYPGAISVSYAMWADRPLPHPIRDLKPATGRVSWWFDGMKRGPGWVASIPIWCPVFVVVGAAVWLWRVDREARSTTLACVRCGYDRRGLAVGVVCPECGAEGGQVL